MIEENTSNTNNHLANSTLQTDTITPVDLLETARTKDNVKVMNSYVPYRSDVCLNDISINASGQNEDKVYAFDAWYRNNIRRGNTIIQTFDNSKRLLETFYGRKGFEKFFDLMHEYIQHNLGEIKALQDTFHIGSATEHYELSNIIFGKARQAMEQNKAIGVYKLVKANGENAQVSWVNSLQSWLIASKNVSLLARNEQDINAYTKDRFEVAKLIAKEWFRIVERLEKEEGNLLNELKEYMNGKTFVGEYCGNQSYQHLVRYSETDIHFFAIVENESSATCLAPEESFAAFEKYKLTHVNYQSMGVYNDWTQLNQTLRNIYINVAKATIDSEEEGSVIYLVQVNENGSQHTLSLSKLKTLEYRIFRKLREKLRNFISQKGNNRRPWREIYNKFIEETKELCKDLETPMKLDYYFNIAREAFEFADANWKQASLIREKYITFISILLHCMSQKKKMTSSILNDQETLQKVQTIPWTDYYNKIEIKEEQKEQKEEETKNTSAGPQKRKVYIVVPIGIPGMGKTYFLNAFRKIVDANGCYLSVISSDDVRKECMDKLARSNKRLSKEQLFEKSGKDARFMFNDRLGSLIYTSDEKDCRAHFIFVDKNHPPNAIRGTMDLINRNGSHLDMEIIALTPLMGQNFFTYEDKGETHVYPFSLNFFFSCFDRVQTRKEHDTLPGGGAKSADVMIMFLHMFRDIQLNKESMIKNGFHRLMEIPFTAENQPGEIPNELVETLNQILRATKPGDKCNNQSLIAKLNEVYEKAQIKFSHPETGFVEERVNKFFDEEILPDLASLSQSVSRNKNVKENIEDLTDPRTQQQNSVYNPSSTPVYLGLFLEKSPLAEIKEYMLQGLELLVNKFAGDKAIEVAYQDIKSGSPSNLYFTADFHVTTLFIGKNQRKRNTEYFKTFRPGHKMEIEIVGFVIVPNKIAAAICYPDQSLIKIENRFPHVTLMKGQWPPKASNDLFEALFGREGPLSKQYKTKEFITAKELTFKNSVKVQQGWGTAYVVKAGPPLKLSAEARASNGY